MNFKKLFNLTLTLALFNSIQAHASKDIELKLQLDSPLKARAKTLYKSDTNSIFCKGIFSREIINYRIEGKELRTVVKAKNDKIEFPRTVVKEGFFKDCTFKLDSFNVEFHTDKYENYNSQYFAAYTNPGKGDMEYDCEIGDFKIHGRSNGITVKCKNPGMNSIDENGFALIRARLK